MDGAFCPLDRDAAGLGGAVLATGFAVSDSVGGEEDRGPAVCRKTARDGAGVALVAAMFTLPVSGTALYMVDQHLHPRNLATAMILLAVWRILGAKRWQAVLLLLVAFLLHPLMAAMGISFCFFFTLALLDSCACEAAHGVGGIR